MGATCLACRGTGLPTRGPEDGAILLPCCPECGGRGAVDVGPACQHDTIEFSVQHHKLVTQDGVVRCHMAELTATCQECREPFIVVGVPVGSSVRQPALKPDGTLQLPMHPVSRIVPEDRDGRPLSRQ